MKLASEREQAADATAACDVSVVVVNWNTLQLLRDCLASLIRHTRERTLEVIVIDNASADGSAAMVRDEFPGVRLIVNPKNLGFAAGCNQGLRVARGRQLLLLNSDTLLEDDAVSRLSAFLDSHPEAGVVSCALANADGTPQPSCGHFPRLLGAFFARLRRGRDTGPRGDFVYPFLSLDQHREVREVDWVAGAVMLVRREVIERVGLLDEGIFLFAEEWDWCFRIRAAGWRILSTPDARIVHLGSGSWVFSAGLLDKARRGGMLYFYRKHYGILSAAGFHLLSAAGAAARAALAAARWLHPRRRVEATQRLRRHWEFLTWAFSPAARRMLTGDDLAAQGRSTPGSGKPRA